MARQSTAAGMDLRCSHVVALVDMDCFYVEVERRYNQNLVGVPVAVRQHPISEVSSA